MRLVCVLSAGVASLAAMVTGAQAADRTWVDEMIANTGIPNQFENISQGEDLAVRHRPSGLECHFGADPIGRLTVFDNPSVPRGDDVGCNVHVKEIVVSFAATRARTAPELDSAAAEFFGDLYGIYPEAKAYTARLPELESPGPALPPIRVHRFTFNYRG